MAASEATAKGAGSEFLLRAWGTENGMPENSASSIAQTQDGYLWLGTFRGLVRFNGTKFTVFNPENTPQLPSAGIVNLRADKRGRLWVSTLAGLVVKDGTRWRAVGTNEGWAGNYVRTFAERANGDLLITTFDGHVLTSESDRLTELPPPPGEPGQGYLGAVDESGRWWLVQRRFVGLWNGQHWIQVHSPNPSVGRSAVACTSARGGGVWVLLAKELLRLRDDREVARISLPQLKGGIWSMMEDSRTDLWVCSYDSGLFQVTSGGELRHWTTTNGVGALSTRVVYEDRENNLWIGTAGDGLKRLTRRRFFAVTDGSPGLQARSVALKHNGGLWVAFFDGGLFRQDETGIARLCVPGPNNEAAYGQSVLEDRAGRLWYSDQDGCWLRRGDRFEKVPLKPASRPSVNALFEDSRGRVWIATREGAVVYEDDQYQELGPEAGLPRGEISGFGEDLSGSIWVAGSEGVFRRENDRFRTVHDADNRPLRGVLCFKADADGTMWLGTGTAGLIRWRDGKMSQIGLRRGLSDLEVRGCVEDEQGYFWMPSNRGIIRASRIELQAVGDGTVPRLEPQLLDQDDGLPSPECSAAQPNCVRDAAGRLWFATRKGVAVIDPAAFRINSQPPPLQVEQLHYHLAGARLKAGGGRTWNTANEVHLSAPFSNPLRLPAGSYGLDVEFEALGYRSPEKVHFEYQLEGFSPNWEDAGHLRAVTIHHLPPGEYVFRVRAANNDGVWNKTGATLAFSVLPFFWQTRWFFTAVSLLFVSLGIGGTWLWLRIRVRRVVERERAANRIRELAGQLIDAQEKERSRLARELHDGLSQNLALQAVELELLGQRPPADRAIITRRMQEFSAQMKKLSSEVHRISHDLHPAKLTQLGLASAIAELCKRGPSVHRLRITFDHNSIPRSLPPAVALCLYRVAQESIQNAAKHSAANTVRVGLTMETNQIQLVIADDGRGFDVGSKQFSTTLGLVSMRERVWSVHGRISIESSPGAGTRVSVCIPLTKGIEP